ncbi:sensor histidine kinase [Eubacterium barkeri]|uniref:histidine kinase n=1 Tax=Eubacterium barkeri TaxID=1528 RepID=A0A1H3AL13_EUBBA|nr:ATP-binding protein [Eubacterium barkeri]SDX30377.1 HAMP domain-containing protein [Eubacterium barkeri]
MTLKIKGKLTIFSAAILLFFSIVVGVLFLGMFSRLTTAIYKDNLEERAEAVAHSMSGFISEEATRSEAEHGKGYGQSESFGKHSYYLRFIDDAAGADSWIVNADGSTFSLDNGETTEQSNLSDEGMALLPRVFQGETVTQEHQGGFLAVPAILVGTPVTDGGGNVIAAVMMDTHATGVSDTIESGIKILLASMVIALGLAILLSSVLAKRFTRPLKRIEETTKILAQGDYSAQTQVVTNDEIGSLAIHVDALAHRLDEASRESEKLERLRQAFIANISHELRTPVTVMRGSLEALKDGVVSDPDQVKAYYTQLVDESIHLERMVNDLLELTRLQNIDYSIEKEHLNLPEVLDNALRTCRQLAAPKSITLDIKRDVQHFPYEGDYGRLRQLFIIILDNAVKFTPVGGTIEIQSNQSSDAMTVRITDHGPGIPPEDLPHIFDRFYKANTGSNQKGTGLGLAIAGQIAARHGISISADSTPGVTTTFTIHIPS